MEAFRLGIHTILARKTIFIWILLLIVGSQAFPWLTPWEEKPSLLEPARAQTAWAIAWLFVLGWGLFQAASFGDEWASKGILEYLRCQGQRRFGRLFQLWGSCLAAFISFVAAALMVSIVTAMPHSAVEARMWIATNLQYAWLLMLAMGPLFLLAIALGTRFNAAAAYTVSVGIALYGLIAIGYLDLFLAEGDNWFLDLVYLMSPHYHLADLTDRLVFKMGALETAPFLQITGYLLGVGCVVTGVGCLVYREKK